MSDRNRPEKDSFDELVHALASGKATWECFERELAAAADLTESQKEEIRTAALCRRFERLQSDPIRNERKLREELGALPPLTDGAKRFIDKFLRDSLVEGAVSQGLRARGQCAGPFDDARDIVALYATCNPRDGADSALARVIPMMLHAITLCFERAENSDSQLARHYELTDGFTGARILAQLANALHKNRPERKGKG
jgi:hypothetical protein